MEQVNKQVNLLWLLWLQKVLPVQKEAARTFCIFLRYNRKQEQRQEMMERLIQGQSSTVLMPQVLLEVIRGLHVGLSVILRSGSGAELLEPPEVP